MGTSFVIGNTLVSSGELQEKASLGDIDRFRRDARSDPSATLDFSTGRVEARDVGRSVTTETRAEVPHFKPIGFGKPLSIEILAAYTGDAPERGTIGSILGRDRHDLMIASAVKDQTTFEAAPRAVNQLQKTVQDKDYVRPSALANGSPIVYYVPSVAASTHFVAVEMVVDSFADHVIEQMDTLIKNAAGLPVFAPASRYLLAGARLTRIFEDLGNVLLESEPFLMANHELRFDTPEVPQTMARQMVFYNDSDRDELSAYESQVVTDGPGDGSPRVKLVHKQTGEEYAGNAPFIIASLDGRERSGLENYRPTLASAALLERFYGSDKRGGNVMESAGQAMKLLNDFTFREKAERIKREKLEQLEPGEEGYDKALKLYNAYRDNIQSDLMQLRPIEKAEEEPSG